MPASFVAANGNGKVDGTQAVLTYTTTRQINTGEHVVVVTQNNGGSVNTQSITVGALSLALDLMGPNTNTHIEQWSAHATADIAAGATVTVTLPSNVSGSIHGICYSLAGIPASGYVDVSAAAAAAAGTSPVSGTTAATALPDSVATACIGYANGTITAAGAGGYTEIDEIDDTLGGSHALQAEYLLLPTTGTQQASWTLTGGSIASDTIIVVYKTDALPAAETLFVTRSNLRMGG